MCKISLWLVEYILNQSTANFGWISNSIEIWSADQWFSWWRKLHIFQCSAAEIWLPNVTHEVSEQAKVQPWMVLLATNEFWRFCKKKISEWNWTHNSTDGLIWYVPLYLCLSKTWHPIGPFYTWFCSLSRLYWLMDHSKLTWTTQPSTMDGQLGDPGFCIFRSTVNIWLRFFVWNFKGHLWNSTQNILPRHWKRSFLNEIEILTVLRFKTSYAFLKRPAEPLWDWAIAWLQMA